MSGAHGAGPNGSGPQHRSGRGRLLGGVVVVVAVVLAVGGIVERRLHFDAVDRQTQDGALPRVHLIAPQHGPPVRTLDLPANIRAWYQAPIYAQVSGYVDKWYKDFGADVKTGDVLATISTPGLDAQYAAAKANFDVAMARYKLAVITAKRWKALQGTQAVSQQEVDVQAANAEAQQAQVEAARHEVARFEALEGFKKLVAPFDGVVTSRTTDIGDYVNAGGGDVGSRGTATELYSVADVHRMRVFVSVPQDYADIISPKMTATLKVPQYPGRVFHATYLATASAFNAASRTVTTELAVENDKRELWPDSFAMVHFEAPSDPSILIVPVGALLFRAEGMQVALVDENNRVRLRDVQVGTNLGKSVQVISGLKPTDRIISSPSAGLLDGEEVRVVDGTPGYNAPTQSVTPPAEHSDTRAMPIDNAAPEAGGRR
ncbi:multidrug efflux pump acriflavin resistance protein AcrB/AcrD/AcrF [Ameyamaea chiangmaiensis NBRC 103196]|uniref:Efflux RND transporter periplasmic adaptor subunit n=1 Tax=Ameyamaea chiangmaiensis TaxID=442969 RepID=A0A850P8U3_9PROT|nr:efflux RND transporter periplasmic adaptor subunit [Ameyamaea chiangmaiensis]MBS4074166.1 efflux RND transporter periplasmic adaptor subunit [Ameyamaea chiangmaiensis]NVN39109.1 efflux RND transporter periplasmic adaptor subunit [Ameyamaea chiangmaiensis]GBQ71109.1 multidrug efflux pump acriflavin resistance protein AcrB/AcrD/AcrF [Ameyamaea chiangmaiensis NBRC 103196]